MGDAAVVALAVAISVGAWAARPVPLAIAVAVLAVALAFARRRRAAPLAGGLVVVGGALLASGLAARAWAGTAPISARAVDEVVTLVGDPEAVSGATRVVVALDGHRVEAWARGSAGAALARRLAGERVHVHGDVGPPPAVVAARLAARHVVGRLEVDTAGASFPGNPASRAANRVRRALVHGAGSMTPTERALFTGFVIGDDRAQPPEVVDDFRAAGLAHLTAVSGQNVAFLLAVAAPLLRRLPLAGRWGLTVGLVVWFALLTRFEPSVLRASGMAVLAATAFATGRPASRLRLLALAVAGFTLIDPLLVHSVGWWLSVAATVGIVVGAAPLGRMLPGPRPLAEAIGVTVAAQLGVAPVSAAVFGAIPLASVPANLLALPAAGPVMVWGLPAGVVAGLVPGPVATVLHLPTRLCVRWLALVARLAARVPLGELRLVPLLVLGAFIAIAVAVGRVRRRSAVGGQEGWASPAADHVRRSSPADGTHTLRPSAAAGRLVAVAAATLGAVAVVGALIDSSSSAVGARLPGGQLWRLGGASALVVDRPDGRLLTALRRRHVDQLDVLVVSGGGGTDVHALDAVLRRYQPRLVLAPAGSRVPGARAPPIGSLIVTGGIAVEVLDDDPFAVRVRAAPPDG